MVAPVQRGHGAVAAGAEAVGARRSDAREGGEAERAAHHEGGVDDARGEARLLRGDVAHRREQQWVEGDPGADPEQDHRRQDVDEVAPVDRRVREEHEPGRCERQPDAERRPDAEAHHELRGETDREGAHDQVRRQEAEPDLQRGVAEDELQVERRQEEPGEHRGCPEHADDVRGRDIAQLEKAEWHQRRRHARLDHEEHGEQRGRDSEQAERLGRAPALVVAVDDRVDREHQRRRHRDRARDVQPPLRRVARRRRQQLQRRDEHGDADRDVDQEDPVPVEHVCEDAAEQHPDRAAAGHHEAEDAHRFRPFARLGEQHHDQRERDGRDNGATEPLNGARRDEQPLRRREPAGE